MSRIVLISAAFLSATIALLVIRPGPDPRAPVSPAGGDDVTRAETDLSDVRDIIRPATELTAAEAAEISNDALGFGLSDSINVASDAASPSPQAASINAMLQDTTPAGTDDPLALLSALGPAATAQPGPGKGTYVVEPGDTLASIAYRFYGQTSARHRIFEANKDRINASGHLQAGIELVLPAN